MSTQALPRYAGLATRAVAFVMDAAIVNGIALVVVGSVSLALSIFGASLGDLPKTLNLVLGVGGWITLNVFYFVGSWSLTGQTAGMRVMSIRVERGKGGRLPVWRGLVRLVGIVLAAIPLFAGYLMILVSDRRRGLQDWLAGSVVVFAYDQDVWGGPLRRRMARERQRLEAGEARDGERRRRLLPSPPEKGHGPPGNRFAAR
jgi:uncharacterized RDD family membrane protein YckC